MHPRMLLNLSDAVLIEFYMSEGIPRTLAKTRVTLSSRIEKKIKSLSMFSLKDEDNIEQDESYSF